MKNVLEQLELFYARAKTFDSKMLTADASLEAIMQQSHSDINTELQLIKVTRMNIHDM